MQGAGAPNVGQVLSGRSYTPSNATLNATVVTPVAAGGVLLPSAYVDGTGHVTNVSTASAYDVYLVGQDDNKSPNTMTTVCPLWLQARKRSQHTHCQATNERVMTLFLLTVPIKP